LEVTKDLVGSWCYQCWTFGFYY